MDLIKKLQEGFVISDGGFGTMLQAEGLKAGELPEALNITRPELITDIHCRYLEAGAQIISTNTFGANSLKYAAEGEFSLESIVQAALDCAKAARLKSGKDAAIGLDLGPTGKLLQPLGPLGFEEAVEVFAQIVRCGAANGADFILIETMTNSLELKAAVLAAKENCELPVVASFMLDQNSKLMTGADIPAVIAMLEGLRVDILGINCGLGPDKMLDMVKEIYSLTSLPICVCPNAGLPQMVDGKTVFNVGAEEFAEQSALLAKAGARMLGGCCGTTPAHIKALTAAIADMTPQPVVKKNFTVVSSYTHAVYFDKKPVLIGERLNPTGKPKLKEALKTGNMAYILEEAVRQQEHGAMVLDVNAGVPEIDEAATMAELIPRLQAVTDLPLQIDTGDLDAMERALRLYHGKPMINSVCGKEESLKAVLPLAAKYGGVLVALTLDEKGIPNSAAERIAIAERIIAAAREYGIEEKDIIFDPLTLTVSSEAESANITLDALTMLNAAGRKSSLGVSNISFGLPNREILNSAFFTMAMDRGLNAAIMNPMSVEMMKAYHAFCALRNLDAQCSEYIGFASALTVNNDVLQQKQKAQETADNSLSGAILHGMKESAEAFTKTMLAEGKLPTQLIDEDIIPALNQVGEGFEKQRIFLPQLLSSAEAAKAAFEIIKAQLPQNSSGSGRQIVLATVKGDIHDIGKNIVKVLLENYGFEIIDLGRDVAPEAVIDCVKEHNIRLVGLSSLMTTTLPAMAETIKLLKAECPACKTMVGGAVLTAEYAELIKADSYGRDAMEAVRYAQSVFGE